MSQYGICLLGSYLTLLAHVHSLVLLTANFDDLKRIAEELVPETVVENIADFISRASAGATISKDNEENYYYNKRSSRQKEAKSEESKDYEDLQTISDEVTTKKSIAPIDSIQGKSLESFREKQRKLNANNKKKLKENYHSKTEQHLSPKKAGSTQAISLESFHNKERKLIPNNKKLKGNYNSKIKQHLNSKKTKHKKAYNPKKNKSSKILDRKTTKWENNSESDLSGENNNVDSKSIKAIDDHKKSVKKSKDNNDNFQQYFDAISVNDIFLKARQNSKDSEIESNEDTNESKINYSDTLSLNQSKEFEKDNNNQRKYVEKVGSDEENNSNDTEEDDGMVTLTTRVEKNEFDQYVNLNYPKSEPVATNGPLALTMVVESRINRPNYK